MNKNLRHQQSAPQTKDGLDFNEQFQKVYELLENTAQSVFITGKAGTGKSTLLRYFRDNTSKNIVVLAPTGVAAVNIQGQTIHSFFRFKPDITLDGVGAIKIRKSQREVYQQLDAIVIDEISMVRADLLDCVDAFLRLHGRSKGKPFGGVQMIMIGDLYQLPPVVASSEEREMFKTVYASPYFFDAKVFQEFRPEFIELEKIYRQKDDRFIGLLNAVRNNSVTDEHLTQLNKRLQPAFKPTTEDLYVYLTTTNDLAERVNQEELARLKTGKRVLEGEITGDFDQKNLPTQVSLELKVGAQVMLLNNDSAGRWINGSMGRIVAIGDEKKSDPVIKVELPDGRRVEVMPYTWDMFRFFYDEEKEAIDSESVGSFMQYPLKLAWAVTIHKSQGKTFSKVIIDIGRGTFSHGQVYVALSRCTSFEGVILSKPIFKKHILMDWRVVNFMTRYQYQISEQACSLDQKRDLLEQAIHQKKAVDIVYLKANDEKSRRTIQPRRVGQMEYLGKNYLGVEGFCKKRQESRVFRVDRILEIKVS